MISPRPRALIKATVDDSLNIPKNKTHDVFSFEVNNFREAFDRFLRFSTKISGKLNDPSHPCSSALSYFNDLISKKLIKFKNEEGITPQQVAEKTQIFYDGLKSLILNFVNEYSDHLVKDPWNIKGEYNENWIKVESYLPGPGLLEEVQKCNPTVDDRCRGVVVYYSANPKHFELCFPFTEIYFIVLKMEKADRKIYYEFYRDFYYMLYYSLAENDSRREKFLDIIKLCSSKYEAKTKKVVKKTTKNGEGDPIEGYISAGVELASNFGLNFDKDKVINTYRNVDKKQVVDTVTKFAEPFQNTNIFECEDPVNTVLEKIGQVCNDSTVKNNITSITNEGKKILKDYSEEIKMTTEVATEKFGDLNEAFKLENISAVIGNGSEEENDDEPPPLESTD